MRYAGPLLHEPLAVELHNTLYAAGGATVDGLADDPSAWLAALADRIPEGGAGAAPGNDELIALREVVTDVLRAALAGRAPARAALDALNRASARAPSFTVVRWGVRPHRELAFDHATRADVIVSALAADAIELLTGPGREQLRACEAPGCRLLFVKDHPRREWCSPSCGNRARQARHYRRTRERRQAG